MILCTLVRRRRLYRARTASFVLLLLVFVAAPAAENFDPISRPFEFTPGPDKANSIGEQSVRGAVEILPHYRDRPHQLSGLAWDADENTLYALSDDSYLMHLRPVFERGRLAAVQMLALVELRNRKGEPLAGNLADSEGLAIRHSENGISGDTELFISFEIAARVDRYDPAGNFKGGTLFKPTPLSEYPYSHPNRMLEAVAWHPEFGLVTMPEKPLTDATSSSIPVIGANAHFWQYPLADIKFGAVVGATFSQRNTLIVLERHFGSLTDPLLIRILETAIPQSPIARLEPRVLLSFSSTAGWPVDNFEGITRHQGDCYFMVSDDNHKAWQKTLLVYLDLARVTARAGAASAQPDCTGGSDSRADAE